MSEDRLSCSFCGLNKLQTKILVAGQDAHICDQCIEQAFSILNHQNKSNESSINPLFLPLSQAQSPTIFLTIFFLNTKFAI